MNDWSNFSTEDLRFLRECLSLAWDGQMMSLDWDTERELNLKREIEQELETR